MAGKSDAVWRFQDQVAEERILLELAQAWQNVLWSGDDQNFS